MSMVKIAQQILMKRAYLGKQSNSMWGDIFGYATPDPLKIDNLPRVNAEARRQTTQGAYDTTLRHAKATPLAHTGNWLTDWFSNRQEQLSKQLPDEAKYMAPMQRPTNK